MFEDELRQLLEELCATTRAADAYITRSDASSASNVDNPNPSDSLFIHSQPLGGGAVLEVRFTRISALGMQRAAAIEFSARALRACARRWNQPLPDLGGRSSLSMRDRILNRIRQFLGALAAVKSATNAIVTVRGAIVTSAHTVDDLQRSRLEFLLRRVDAKAISNAPESSHAELTDEDCYVLSFWFGACLIVFFDGPYASDFIRHRARALVRELAVLLPDLDDPPTTPVQVAPIPE